MQSEALNGIEDCPRYQELVTAFGQDYADQAMLSLGANALSDARAKYDPTYKADETGGIGNIGAVAELSSVVSQLTEPRLTENVTEAIRLPEAAIVYSMNLAAEPITEPVLALAAEPTKEQPEIVAQVQTAKEPVVDTPGLPKSVTQPVPVLVRVELDLKTEKPIVVMPKVKVKAVIHADKSEQNLQILPEIPPKTFSKRQKVEQRIKPMPVNMPRPETKILETLPPTPVESRDRPRVETEVDAIVDIEAPLPATRVLVLEKLLAFPDNDEAPEEVMTIETLLDIDSVEQTYEQETIETYVPFSEQLEQFVRAEVAEPEQEAALEQVVIVRELVELTIESDMDLYAELFSEVNELSELTLTELAEIPITEELQKAIVELLQTLGIPEPTEHQVRQCVAQFRSEVIQARKEQTITDRINDILHERHYMPTMHDITQTLLSADFHKLLGQLAVYY